MPTMTVNLSHDAYRILLEYGEKGKYSQIVSAGLLYFEAAMIEGNKRREEKDRKFIAEMLGEQTLKILGADEDGPNVQSM